MASLDDVVTTSKNIVTALNTSSQTNLAINGTKTYVAISANTLVNQGASRIVRISVIVAGSTTGSLYDASSVAGAVSGNIVATIPEAVGIYEMNIPTINGIVVKPGTSMVLAVVYS